MSSSSWTIVEARDQDRDDRRGRTSASTRPRASRPRVSRSDLPSSGAVEARSAGLEHLGGEGAREAEQLRECRRRPARPRGRRGPAGCGAPQLRPSSSGCRTLGARGFRRSSSTIGVRVPSSPTPRSDRRRNRPMLDTIAMSATLKIAGKPQTWMKSTTWPRRTRAHGTGGRSGCRALRRAPGRTCVAQPSERMRGAKITMNDDRRRRRRSRGSR